MPILLHFIGCLHPIEYHLQENKHLVYYSLLCPQFPKAMTGTSIASEITGETIIASPVFPADHPFGYFFSA